MFTRIKVWWFMFRYNAAREAVLKKHGKTPNRSGKNGQANSVFVEPFR